MQVTGAGAARAERRSCLTVRYCAKIPAENRLPAGHGLSIPGTRWGEIGNSIGRAAAAGRRATGRIISSRKPTGPY
jgi:hypothetical protein